MDRTNHRRTPLHLAVVKKQAAALAALIDLGADARISTDAVGPDAAGSGGARRRRRDGAAADRRRRGDHAAGRHRSRSAGRYRAAGPRRSRGPVDDEQPSVGAAARSRERPRVWTRDRDAAPHVMRHRSGLSIVNMEDDQETAVDGASRLHAAPCGGIPWQQRCGRGAR